MTGPSGNSEFCFPSTFDVPLASPGRGTLWSRGNETHCFPWSQSLSAYCCATRGEKRETSAQTLQRSNVARQVEGFCISYFATLKQAVSLKKRSVSCKKYSLFPLSVGTQTLLRARGCVPTVTERT